MKIHHLRNATMVIETQEHVILIDPMLGPKGFMSTLTLFRFKPQRNPIVPFPREGAAILQRITHCLITHLHPDHLDKEGIKFLTKNNIPVICSTKDVKQLKKQGLNVVQSLEYEQRTNFLGGKIEGIPALHGYGFIAKPMGNVMGFYIELPNQPTIYLSSDTIFTSEVENVLTEYQPDISVIAAGSAQLDLFKPLLMTLEDIIRFTRLAPGKVIANHMEAINHCPTTRTKLKETFARENLSDKTFIPYDGEVLAF